MKKILLIATAALFAWTASAQDNNYRNTRDNNRNAAQAGNYRSTPDNYRSDVGSRVNFYTNTEFNNIMSEAYGEEILNNADYYSLPIRATHPSGSVLTTGTVSIPTGVSNRRSMS